jgi:hypothetical protein
MQAWCPMPAVGPASAGVPVSLPAVLSAIVLATAGALAKLGPPHLPSVPSSVPSAVVLTKAEGPAKVEAGRRRRHQKFSPVFTSGPRGALPCTQQLFPSHSRQFADSSHFAFCILHFAFVAEPVKPSQTTSSTLPPLHSNTPPLHYSITAIPYQLTVLYDPGTPTASSSAHFEPFRGKSIQVPSHETFTVKTEFFSLKASRAQSCLIVLNQGIFLSHRAQSSMTPIHYHFTQDSRQFAPIHDSCPPFLLASRSPIPHRFCQRELMSVNSTLRCPPRTPTSG